MVLDLGWLGFVDLRLMVGGACWICCVLCLVGCLFLLLFGILVYGLGD